MPIVTLLSDWGTTDHYVGAMKGTLLSLNPAFTIVDISHDIRLYDMRHAAFVMKNVWRTFPKGTIHIISIDCIESEVHPHVVAESEGHYFIAADTGLLSLILHSPPEHMVAINTLQDSFYFTFPARDRFAKVAALLASGSRLDEIGLPYPQLVQKTLMEADFDGKVFYGKVMYIDRYQNAFVNITERMVREKNGNKDFRVTFRSEKKVAFVKAYGDVSPGTVCALFASNGYLQIAVNRGQAATLFNLNIDTEVLLILGN